MKKIILTSAGLSNQKITEEFLRLLNKPASETKIIFVPTASRTEEELFYVNKSKKQLFHIGVKDENIKVLHLDHEVFYDEVKDYDVIYVGGGNTFYILHKVRESGFDKIIKQFVDSGKIYFGVSAGSYIACPTIEMATWKRTNSNDIGLKDLTGLSLVPFLMTAHFDSKYKSAVPLPEPSDRASPSAGITWTPPVPSTFSLTILPGRASGRDNSVNPAPLKTNVSPLNFLTSKSSSVRVMSRFACVSSQVIYLKSLRPR